jgi:transposase
MSTDQKTVIRYSIGFKRKVVDEIEQEGLLIQEASRRYGIKGGTTVRKWVIKFGKHHLLNKLMRVETMEEKDRIKELESENKKLKVALADSMMEKRCLEVLIEEADKAYKTDLKKNFADNASRGSVKSTGL